jgi:hypothetical protein
VHVILLESANLPAEESYHSHATSPRAQPLLQASKTTAARRQKKLLRHKKKISDPEALSVKWSNAGSSGTMSLTLSHHHGQSEGEEFSPGAVAVLLHLVCGSAPQTRANGSEFYTGLRRAIVEPQMLSIDQSRFNMEQPRVFFMNLNVLCDRAEKLSKVTALLLCLPCSANRHDILGVLCAPWEHEKALWYPCTTVATLERTDPMSCYRSTVGASL